MFTWKQALLLTILRVWTSRETSLASCPQLFWYRSAGQRMKDLFCHCQNYYKPEKPLSFEPLACKLCQYHSYSKLRMKQKKGMCFRWDFLQHLSKIDSYFLPFEGNSKIHLCLTGSRVLLTQKNFMKSLYEELYEKPILKAKPWY